MEQPLADEGRAMRPLGLMCDVSASAGALVLVAIACMTVVSVIGRAFFAHPILGDVELVQLFKKLVLRQGE